MFDGAARFPAHDGFTARVRPSFFRHSPTVKLLRLESAGIVPAHARAVGDCQVQTCVIAKQEYRDVVDPRIEVSGIGKSQAT